MKVGRAALDEDAIRLIEESNPDIDFDWTRILKGQGNDQPSERRTQTTPGPRPQPPSRPKAAQVETPAPDPSDEEQAPPLDESPTAAGARLGAEGLARLRGRYAEMLARIDERAGDPQRQDELKTLAERLNPDAWVTDSDVTAGLDDYEATFEALRSVVGRGRRRGRGRHRV